MEAGCMSFVIYGMHMELGIKVNQSINQSMKNVRSSLAHTDTQHILCLIAEITQRIAHNIVHYTIIARTIRNTGIYFPEGHENIPEGAA